MWRPQETDGVRYGYIVDGEGPFPDPRSRRQPDGVHALSATFDPSAHEWKDDEWKGRSLKGSVIYELHLGTFTPEGTLDAAAGKLDYLADLGVDFIELLPVNGFNGVHNWGYDGVLWYAVHEPYGGPAAYQRFVDAAHAAGLGVIQDVVYNHLGPSGNYLPKFGPYLKSGEGNTWGDSVNLDGPGSDDVRRYILDNAAMWLRDYHVDGLRLDAVHALRDERAVHILEEFGALGDAVAAETGMPRTLIAESDLNNPRLHVPARRQRLRPGGAVERRLPPRRPRQRQRGNHRLLRDFDSLGSPGQGPGAWIPPRWQLLQLPGPAPRTAHQRPIWSTRPRWWSACQNHDQIGNRATGDRLSQSLSLRTAGHRRCADPDVPVHAHAVYGGGVAAPHAVAVLHLPPGT